MRAAVTQRRLATLETSGGMFCLVFGVPKALRGPRNAIMIGTSDRHHHERIERPRVGAHLAVESSESATALSTTLWAICAKGRLFDFVLPAGLGITVQDRTRGPSSRGIR